VGQLLEALPNCRLRLVGEVMGELLRVASLHAQTAAAEGQGSGVEEHACGADDSSLRSATHELVQCCLRRLEASDTAYMGLSLRLCLCLSLSLSLSVSVSVSVSVWCNAVFAASRSF
jgi:hypothetical protein